MRGTSIVAVCGLGAVLGLGQVGCSGQGNYTREGASVAKERMNAMKSATEWEMGRQAFVSGDLEKALRKVDASLSLNQNVVKSHVLRARIMIEKGELGQSLRSLNTAITLDPQDADAHYYLGVTFERLNRPQEAAEHFMIASEVDEYNPGHAVAAAEMLVDMNQTEEARQYLLALPSTNDNAGIRQMLGHIALIQGDKEAAVGFFSQARLLAPDDQAIQEDLIRAQMQVGQYAAAELNIAAIRQNKANATRRDLMQMHAEALMGVNRPVEARALYQELLNDPNMVSDVQAWIGLGNASYLVNDQRTLRRAASRVVALAPSSYEGYALWALCHRRDRQFDKALSSVDQAILRAPSDPSFHGLRAMILADQGRTNEAVLAARKAAQLAPNEPKYETLQSQLRTGTYATVPVTE
jgi:Flp pilus assembly protein TadD